MIFVDTSAWYASVVPGDPDHQNANDFIHKHRRKLFTSDYVLDELLTLLSARNRRRAAILLGTQIFDERLARLIWVEDQDIRRAWEVFQSFKDKAWSFTDCTSKVVMERLGIQTAFAFDHHFKQFGTITVVP